MVWEPLFKNDFAFYEPFNVFKFIRSQILDRNESFDIFIGGDRGLGKSSCAMTIALMLDPTFTIDRWCFKTEKYLEFLKCGLNKGSVIVFDEIGTQESGSSRKWQSQDAHDLADITQVNRTDGLITIGTSLDIGRGEKRLRAGFRIMVTPVRKISDAESHHGMAIDAEMRLRHADVFTDEIRYQLWRYANEGRIKLVRLYHPPKEIWNNYQNMRSEFLTGIKQTDAPKITNNMIDKEYANIMNIKIKNVVKYRRLLKMFVVHEATDKQHVIPITRLKDEIEDIFAIVSAPSILKVIRTLITQEMVYETKVNRDETAFWLTETGYDFYMKEAPASIMPEPDDNEKT